MIINCRRNPLGHEEETTEDQRSKLGSPRIEPLVEALRNHLYQKIQATCCQNRRCLL